MSRDLLDNQGSSKYLLLCCALEYFWVLTPWSPFSAFYKEHLGIYIYIYGSSPLPTTWKPQKWQKMIGGLFPSYHRCSLAVSFIVSIHSECGDILYVLFCFVLNRRLIRQWTVAKVLIQSNYFVYQRNMFLISRVIVKSQNWALILPTGNITWLMTVAFVCVSKAWFHSSTGKAHLSHVLKKQI